MTYRWLTFFSAAAILAAADVVGRIELLDSREAPVRKGRDFSGVAVWVEPTSGTAPPPDAAAHSITQKGKRFSPHISVVPVGTVVDFPNLDPIFHNAFSNFAGQPFDTGLYPPGGTKKVKFVRPGVVRIFCNIHSTMSAVIIVVATPWHTASDKSGSFRIAGVPPGEYVLKVWHERAKEETLRALERRVTVSSGEFAAGTIAISEAGWLALPHKNKYGQDYPPEPEEKVPYGGGRK